MTNEKRQCCFCGDAIIKTSQEPLMITMTFADGGSQAMWTHIDCMGVRLHASVVWLSTGDREELEE